MKRLIFLLAACFVLAVSAPLGTADARNTMTVELRTASDTLAAYAQQNKQLEKAEAQIEKLEQQVEGLQKQEDWFVGPVALVGTILVCILPVAIVFIGFYFKFRNRRARYELISKILAAGQPIPTEMIEQICDTEGRSSLRLIQTGIRILFFGIAFTALFAFLANEDLYSVGFFIAIIGLGAILSGYVQKREEEKRKREKQPAPQPDTTEPTATTDEQ